MSLRADLFLKLQTAKSQVTKMPKKSHVRTLMDIQHVKGTETLLQSARQYFCHILWPLSRKISSKNSVLVVSEILKLLVKSLTPDDKYSLSINRVFNATNSDATISKSKNIFWSFLWIFGIYKKLGILWKKRWPS